MNIGKYLFAHVIDFIPHYQFDNLVKKTQRWLKTLPRTYQDGCLSWLSNRQWCGIYRISTSSISWRGSASQKSRTDKPQYAPKSIPRYFAKFSLLTPYRHYFTFYFTIPLYRLILNLQMFDPNHTQPSYQKFNRAGFKHFISKSKYDVILGNII